MQGLPALLHERRGVCVCVCSFVGACVCVSVDLHECVCVEGWLGSKTNSNTFFSMVQVS